MIGRESVGGTHELVQKEPLGMKWAGAARVGRQSRSAFRWRQRIVALREIFVHHYGPCVWSIFSP
jgi:hypothetical protein